MNFGRKISFVLITIVYIFAAACGIFAYTLMSCDMWLSLLIADILATVVVFMFSVIFKNASVYDPYWSVQPIVILAALLFEYGLCSAALLPLVAVFLWGVRLTANWAYTFHGLGHQDWRYTMLKEKCGKLYPFVNFVGIHLVPTLVVYLVTLPVCFILEKGAEFSPVSLIFFVIALLSVLLQGTADFQMHSYRKSRETPFIERGVWRYSRHPNYLAEILMWWSISLYSVVTLGLSWYLIAGAVANTALFLFVSIPMADGRQSRKEGFSAYKARTRMLLPFKK